MKALITGGAGFVGSHLSEALLERGADVHVVDNLSTGAIDNIAHLKPNNRFGYTIDSVLNEPMLAELVDRADVVFHLAAAVGVKKAVDDLGATCTEAEATDGEAESAREDRLRQLAGAADLAVAVHGAVAEDPLHRAPRCKSM